jgi:hypothetical protein
MKKFFKQPNGLYCYFSYNGIEGFDLTEEDIKRIYVEEAEIEADEAIKKAKNFGVIIEELLHRDTKCADEWLKQIGFTEPYETLIKYVPRKPTNQQYVGCDFTTYGKCPSCGERVQNCMGNGQEKCKCGQRLKWE